MNMVICFDGTWNDPTEQTNVFKLFTLLPGKAEEIDAKGPIRSHLHLSATGLEAFYLEGVGSNGRAQGILGGSLGIGLHDRVIDAFVLASQVYTPGDKLWIFGFSRGAWSARSLAGMIARAGLLETAIAADDDGVDAAEKLWIETKHGSGAERGQAFWAQRDTQPIRLVGVWDTVGALGVPFFNGVRAIDQLEKRLFDFADLKLSPLVEFGRHALAIDETRFDFTPTLWEDRDGVRQAWFAGVHGDIGGGYMRDGLSDVALLWMVGEVNSLKAGLSLDLTRLDPAAHADPLQDRHDEARKTVWQLRPTEPRKLPATASLDASVFERLRQRADYRPAALAARPDCAAFYPGTGTPERLLPQDDLPLMLHLDQVGTSTDCRVFAQKWWNASGLAVKQGESYRITAQGEWKDDETSVSADGYASTSVWLKMAEGTRRVEAGRWFALIACVHSDPTLEARNPESGNFLTGGFESFTKHVGKIDADSQSVVIGVGHTFTADRDGCLYLYANDSAFAYSNNSLFVSVDISRVA